jgi:NTE family protein
VLSGGGAKAAAHIGAVRALQEGGLTPARFVATSMGAVIAAGLASGIAGDELLDWLTEVGARGISRDPLAIFRGLFARSLMRQAPFRRALEAIVQARRFAELQIPLTVSVTDLDTGELLLYGAGGRDAPLRDVLAATTALPLYFPPVLLEGRRCGDGGLRGVLRGWALQPAAHVPRPGMWHGAWLHRHRLRPHGERACGGGGRRTGVRGVVVASAGRASAGAGAR